MTNYQKSKHIIQSLVRGDDPLTGRELPKDSVLDNSEVLRAFLDAVGALEHVTARQARRAMLPSEVGKTWTDDEESTLKQEHQSGITIPDIAAAHKRTVRAIEARLEKLGLLRADQRTTNNSFTGAPRKDAS